MPYGYNFGGMIPQGNVVSTPFPPYTGGGAGTSPYNTYTPPINNGYGATPQPPYQPPQDVIQHPQPPGGWGVGGPGVPTTPPQPVFHKNPYGLPFGGNGGGFQLPGFPGGSGGGYTPQGAITGGGGRASGGVGQGGGVPGVGHGILPPAPPFSGRPPISPPLGGRDLYAPRQRGSARVVGGGSRGRGF